MDSLAARPIEWYAVGMVRQKNRKKITRRLKTDEAIVVCAKCGHEHFYKSLDMLNDVPMSHPCEKCGFPFLEHSKKKMEAMLQMVTTDKRARELFTADDPDAFWDYVEEKTGLF